MAHSFIGRRTELQALQGKLGSEGFQMAVIYGRRRVGKTTLINQLIDGASCKSISFVAMERGESELIQMMGEAVLSSLAPDLQGAVRFDRFESIFDYVANAARNERIIFLIDEFPYLAKECPYINSLLQKYADHDWKSTELYLVLCGSLVSFMKEEVLGENAALHGRSTLELKIRPMGYLDSAEFVPHYTNEEKAIVYGLAGGVPKYLEQFDDARPLDENIIEQFYTSAGYFSEEQIRTLVTSDRTSPSAFNSVIAAIATGHTRYGEIASAAGINDIAYYLKALMAAEIIERRSSAGKPYYVVADKMVEFWFKHVSRAASLINAGRGELYYERNVKGRLHEHMGRVFEDMARQYAFAHMGTDRFPFFATQIEEYQASYKTGGKVRQIELDLVGTDGKNISFVGECKFRNQQFDEKDYEDFAAKLAYLPARNPGVAVFSLGGFTPAVLDHDALLVTLDQMYE